MTEDKSSPTVLLRPKLRRNVVAHAAFTEGKCVAYRLPKLNQVPPQRNEAKCAVPPPYCLSGRRGKEFPVTRKRV